MRRLQKWLRLSTREKGLLIQAVLLLNGIRLSLKFCHFRVWQPLLRQDSPSAAPQSIQPSALSLSRIVWAVNVASRFSPGVQCLARALTTRLLLHQYGYEAHIRLGAKLAESGQFQAHAWVESQGAVVIGQLSDLSTYAPLGSWGANRL